jgi:hypothetical protein
MAQLAPYGTLNWQMPGLSDVGSYQMSGIPFATSSLTVPASGSTTKQVTFPGVTKFVTISNETTGTNSPLRVGFSDLGVKNTNNYFVLDNGESYTGEWRVTSIYMMGNNSTGCTASVIAGITNIPNIELSSNWSGSSGVG